MVILHLFDLLQLSDTTSRFEGSQQLLESLQLSLAEETGRRQLVEKRFRDLAQNHEHMINLKDEYKEKARRLEGRLEGGEAEREREALEQEMERKEGEWRERERGWEERVREGEGRIKTVETERDQVLTSVRDMEKEKMAILKEHLASIDQLQISLKGELDVYSEMTHPLNKGHIPRC